MLFNSLPFLLVFLPVAVAGYWAFRRTSILWANVFLALMSLAFYGWWKAENLPILVVSIAFNFAVGYRLSRHPIRWLLVVGVAANLAGLAWYKYSGFLAENLGVGGSFEFPELPIGISFFTFTQIAFLVDVYQRKAAEPHPANYTLFVSYFPHLIAGPILHHKEMMPQFADQSRRNIWLHLAIGLAVFTMGMVKKVFLADPAGAVASPLFALSDKGQLLSVADAWTAALAYSIQIYFDFSGYCDMACGISFMLGIRLPINFFSPYKATSIIDFWRRWHMTLSRFLRDYLYIPLGGNRHGEMMRYRNLALTMVLGGIWHGAAWTFVVWGMLHGSYLVINHLFRDFGWRLQPLLGWALTFVAVVVGWVFFRAGSLASAGGIICSMAGRAELGNLSPLTGGHILALLAFALFAPNVYQVMARYKPALLPPDLERNMEASAIAFKPTLATGIGLGVAMFACIFLITRAVVPSEFLYFQF